MGLKSVFISSFYFRIFVWSVSRDPPKNPGKMELIDLELAATCKDPISRDLEMEKEQKYFRNIALWSLKTKLMLPEKQLRLFEALPAYSVEVDSGWWFFSP